MELRVASSVGFASVLLLAAAPAHADGPPPGYVPAAPGYAPVPGAGVAPVPPGYGFPPGYGSPYAAPRPPGYGYPAPAGYYPPGDAYGAITPMKRRSPTMIALGSTFVSIATTTLIAGSALVAGSSNSGTFACDGLGDCSQTTDSTAKNTGIGLVVVGAISMAVGIPLIIVGVQKVPDRDEASVSLPTLRIGAGSARIGVDF